MFNIAVINIKDLIKYLVGLIFASCILILLTRYFSVDKNNNYINKKVYIQNIIENLKKNSYSKILENTMPMVNETPNNGNKEFVASIPRRLLQVELSKLELDSHTVSNSTDENNEKDIESEKKVENNNKNNETEVITSNPIIANPTDIYGKVQIRNQTGYILNEQMLQPNIEVEKNNIIIFHTHTCESYTATEQNQYEASGNYRTIDLNHSVARVGDELTNYLSNYGYNVIHDKTYHDYPSYTGSYARSLKTVEKIMKDNKADVIIDLHRDAIGSNSEYAPTVRIGEDYAAQLMFVIGTDGGGMLHPNWNQNLKFAVKVQEKAEELYPGLFKPIIVRNARFNQHVSKAAVIIEVGATGNTLEQCLTSMKYLSKVLDETIK